MPENSELQSYIFESLKPYFKNQAEVVSALKDLIHLTQDGVYRRLRGESYLTLDEIEKIAIKYKISLDAHVFRNTDIVSFQFNPFVKTIRTYDDYMNELYNAVKPLSQLKALKLKCAASELPLFYFLSSPQLFAFKMFVFARSVWNFDNIKKEKFSISLISQKTQEKANAIWDTYKVQNTIEMWDLNILDSTLNQIEHYFLTNVFLNRTDALELCDSLLELITDLETMVSEGKKSRAENVPEDSFILYHNEIIHTNNTILIESDSHKIVYSTFVSPDFMRTTDRRVVEYKQKWFNDIISNSTQISKQGEKIRNYFFGYLYKKIAHLKQKIK